MEDKKRFDPVRGYFRIRSIAFLKSLLARPMHRNTERVLLKGKNKVVAVAPDNSSERLFLAFFALQRTRFRFEISKKARGVGNLHFPLTHRFSVVARCSKARVLKSGLWVVMLGCGRQTWNSQ